MSGGASKAAGGDQQPQDGAKRKRGVKPAADYMNIAVDNLENLYIDYASYPYKKDLTSAEKKERARRRNEISALESRITKKI